MNIFFEKSLISRRSVVVFGALSALILTFLAIPAVTPKITFASGTTLSIGPENTVVNGNYGSTVITVYGPDNSAVQLYYYPVNQYPNNQYSSTNSNSPVFVTTLGTTQSNGYFSMSISDVSYNIPAGAQVYVVVDGQESNSVSWPNSGLYSNNGSSYVPQYNQAPTYPSSIYPTPYSVPVAPIAPAETGSLSVGVGQSITLYAQSQGSYSITSNSNSEVVSATANGNSVTIYGDEVGSTVITICPLYYSYNSSPCASVEVTVTPNLSFSQSNITLYGLGSSQTITLNSGNNYNGYATPACTVSPYGGNTYNNGYYGNGYSNNGYSNCGQYYIAANSNPGVVSAGINGNNLYVSGIGYGGATITVCQSSGSPCGTVYVSVNGAVTNNTYYSNYYPYQSQPQNVYVYPPQPVYNYSRPIYVMPGWTRRR